MAGKAPPLINFSRFNGSDAQSKLAVVTEIRDACLEKGFFQITGHGISQELQDAILAQTRDLFDLPDSNKKELNKDLNEFNRGYEGLRAQAFEKGSKGDLKEGFYIGKNLPLDHPAVKAKRFNQGPNIYPETVPDPQAFKQITSRYFEAMTSLANDILRAIALGLELEEGWFNDFSKDPLATLRLLHYPTQQPDSAADERGIGAHTDFGAITILLQDQVGGLQVYDKYTSTWIDAPPIPGAFVVNLGNLMMRWSNDQYISNLHRVINKSGRERYSIPFFFAGNSDYVIKCLPNCASLDGRSKYPPVKVEDWMKGRYMDTYGGEESQKTPDLLAHHINA